MAKRKYPIFHPNKSCSLKYEFTCKVATSLSLLPLQPPVPVVDQKAMAFTE